MSKKNNTPDSKARSARSRRTKSAAGSERKNTKADPQKKPANILKNEKKHATASSAKKQTKQKDGVVSKTKGSPGAGIAHAVAGLRGSFSSVLVSRTGFLIVVGVLIVFGLVMLYSASSIYSYNQSGDYTAIFYKQVIFVAIGVVVALVIALLPYRVYSLTFSVVALGASIPFLVLVLGQDAALGASRWFDLGFTTIQPSEFAKIAMILVLAHLVDRCRDQGYSVGLIVMMIIACAVPIGLIIIEPDLGTTIIAVIGILAVLWFGGVPKRVVAVLTLGLVVLAAVAVFGTGFRQARITAWLDPSSDPLGDGYQLLNSYYAFGEGGLFGVGLGLSKQKFSWLPQGENDFIFAIVGEELGLLGALLIVLLFVGLVFMALKIARNAPDALGAMFAGSSGVILGAQAFLNMLCVVGAIPTTGKPLPFFSAGGSSIISTMILVGIIFSVSLHSSEASVYDFRREQFTVVSGGAGRSIGSRSALDRLPNPAALIASSIRSTTQPQPQVRKKRAAEEKVVPISRGQAERSAREREKLRKKREGYHTGQSGTRAAAPVSMSSLRRNRVRQSTDTRRRKSG